MDRAYSTSIYYDFLVTGIKIPDYNMKRSSGTVMKHGLLLISVRHYNDAIYSILNYYNKSPSSIKTHSCHSFAHLLKFY
jgi:hypothetical protein